MMMPDAIGVAEPPAQAPLETDRRRTGRPGGPRRRMNPARAPIVIPRSYRRPSDTFGVRATATIMITLLAAVAALPVLVRSGWLAVAVAIVPLIGALSVKTVMLLEECARGTLFRTPALNQAVGHLCGGLVGLSVSALARRGGLRGSQGIHGRCPPEARRRALFLLAPLTGLSMLRHLGRADGLPARVWRSRRLDVRRDAPVWREMGVLVTAQTALAVVASGFGELWWLAIVYPASAATFGVFFDRARWFCERVPVAPASPAVVIRSHIANSIDRVLFYTLNRHLYVEASLFPSIPACHLPRIHRDLARAGYFTSDMVSASMLVTIGRALTGGRHARRRGSG